MVKKAFTLIELLVVIAIIAILMAILMPVLNAAKDHARRIHCVANVKTLALGWFMYKDDYDDRIIKGYTPTEWEPDDWVHSAQNRQTLEEKLEAIKDGLLFPYVGNTVEVYRCPADLRLKNPTRFCYRSFSIAGGANGENWPGYTKAIKYSDIRRPGTKYVFVEDIDPRGENVGCWEINYSPQQWVDPLAMWHNRKTTLGFADGHSEMHKWHDQSFIDWCQTHTNAALYNTAYSFYMTPPDDEREDYEYMARHFPCKSHADVPFMAGLH